MQLPYPDRVPLLSETILRAHTVHALRAAGVLTLGELQAMGDRDLLALRRFGRRMLADVRFLLPAPEGGRR